MHWYAITDVSGRIMRTCGALFESEALSSAQAMAADPNWTARPAPDVLFQDRHWWDGAAWADRPAPPPPPALTPDTLVMWTGLPPGCTVTVIDPATGLVPDGGSDVIGPTGALSFMLPAGPWRLEVSEKFPFKAVVFEVEV